MSKKSKRPNKKDAKKLIKLDIGCGQNKNLGYIGIDWAKIDGVDIVHDLLKFPWPIENESVETSWCSHFFEHVPGELRFAFMDEVYRILIPDGQITLITPYYSSMRAIQDPTHRWPPVSETSYLYFNKNWRVQNKLDHYPVKCDFDFAYYYHMNPNWAGRSEETRQFAILQYVNTVSDLQVTLTKKPMAIGE